MNHEKRSITRTESQGKGRGITIKVVSLKPRPLDTQLIVIIIHARQNTKSSHPSYFPYADDRS